MNFRTSFPIAEASFQIDHRSAVWLEGSCFASHMARKMQGGGFDVASPSFGVLYNPIAIARCISAVANNRRYNESELISNRDRWLSLHHHTQFQSDTSSGVLQSIHQSINQAHSTLGNSSSLVVTFGTAYAWQHKNGEIAGNCNRLPQQDFQKRMCSLSEMVEAVTAALEHVFLKKPSIQVILTVSPVRHTREGVVQNMHSKARLLELCHALCALHKGRVHYFPAFEIMFDDLRDYRFYEADMIHPSSVAVDYIWEKFSGWCMSSDVKKLTSEIETVLKVKNHISDSLHYQELIHRAEAEAIERKSAFYAQWSDKED
jgi:hypothetical protein